MTALIFTWVPVRAEDLYDREPINYLTATPDDPISRLQDNIDNGKVKLQYEPEQGYLKSVLEALEVPVSSQGLVFSKTSLQQRFISAFTPRAVYFNDDTYIGWVQHGTVLEISTVDPHLGGVFYTLPQEEVEQPRFKRQTHECLQCHATHNTRDVPGHLVRSVFATRQGRVNFGMGTHRLDDQTPFQNRWGGWYVTGQHGALEHLGNNFVTAANESDDEFNRAGGSNITDLSTFFNVERYLTPHSDLVALLVLEHQTQMHNILTQSHYYGQFALRDEEIIKTMVDQLNASNKETQEVYVRTESIQRRIDNAAERIVQSLLFVKAIEFENPVSGTSSFTAEFNQRGPVDSQGRSLRTLDLEKRLFKYPCSFLIYSSAFDSLPAPVLESVYRQLWEVLTNQNQSEEFAHLDSETRQAILNILLETKNGLPPYWREAVEKPSELADEE
ncbi:MAG: hypothetical protein R3C11_13770 [Planctomycetaceae bacterium]